MTTTLITCEERVRLPSLLVWNCDLALKNRSRFEATLTKREQSHLKLQKLCVTVVSLLV